VRPEPQADLRAVVAEDPAGVELRVHGLGVRCAHDDGAAAADRVARADHVEAGGVEARDPRRERENVGGILRTVEHVYPDERFVRAYGDVAARLQRAGRSIGTMDTLIAAMALVDGVALVTANTKHFEGVPGLRVVSYR
jgi:predicted nucleic acid-binding protein